MCKRKKVKHCVSVFAELVAMALWTADMFEGRLCDELAERARWSNSG